MSTKHECSLLVMTVPSSASPTFGLSLLSFTGSLLWITLRLEAIAVRLA
jgi:hypothetical protein